MTTRKRYAAGAFILTAGLLITAAKQEDETVPPPQILLQVDVSDRELHVTAGDELIRTYKVAVGTDEHPTPVGQFRIQRIIWNPGWVPPDTKWARGKSEKQPGDPDNPMRVAKLYFKPPDYFIHGTNKPESLGTAASHGCVRMSEEDVLELGKTVMEHGGKPMPESWFRRLLRRRSSNVVRLAQPIPVHIEP